MDTMVMTMRKFICLMCLLVALIGQLYSLEISELLEQAKEHYRKGELQQTRDILIEAKELIDANLLIMVKDDYQELSTWNLVKINPQKWAGVKVKIEGRFLAIREDSVNIFEIGPGNPYKDQGLAEIIAGFDNRRLYTWYGEVILIGHNNRTPAIFIEHVE